MVWLDKLISINHTGFFFLGVFSRSDELPSGSTASNLSVISMVPSQSMKITKETGEKWKMGKYSKILAAETILKTIHKQKGPVWPALFFWFLSHFPRHRILFIQKVAME
jgi:hypothetical protein